LDEIFAAQIETLATTLRPATIRGYRSSVRHFLTYLHAAFPQVRRLAQLCRDPHLCGWLRELAQRHPPLSGKSRRDYLFDLRRLLEDLADDGHPIQPGLIRRQDFPPRPSLLPRALSPEHDQRLQEELRRCDELLLINTVCLKVAAPFRQTKSNLDEPSLKALIFSDSGLTGPRLAARHAIATVLPATPRAWTDSGFAECF